MFHQWKYAGMSLSFLYWGAWSWTQHSRCGPSTEQSGRITPFDLLATVFLNAAQLLSFFAMRAHAWLVFSLLSTKTPEYFSAKLLSRPSTPSCVVMPGLIPLQVHDLAFQSIDNLGDSLFSIYFYFFFPCKLTF